MSLKNQLKQDLFSAMKSHNDDVVAILRLAISAIKNEEINKGKELSEEEVINVLQKEVKKLKDAIAEYNKADRSDLAEVEERQLAVLQNYVPALMSEEEISKVVGQVISNIQPAGMQDFGKVMGAVMKETQGNADGNDVANIVRNRLQNL